MEILHSAGDSRHIVMIPDCTGTENNLISCFASVNLNINCDYLLVECRSVTQTESSSEDGGVPTAVFAGVGGVVVVIIALILLVILLTVILVRKKRDYEHKLSRWP